MAAKLIKVFQTESGAWYVQGFRKSGKEDTKPNYYADYSRALSFAKVAAKFVSLDSVTVQAYGGEALQVAI